ncbi:uncharacterized protein F4812DRAFT_304505 [Daldinia caldariorum]|uniref:uncharacterized protein n=1 Tax=Daldinia caldariorum TaxID=326644 RepID=UPI0020078CD6|nr:uncharacterized protein F4812DRAFT_304505 [Daldinia caldariorum]KAI1469829.1 hypothetical protein F4812DRAFT_304505 [Daldinia caldariorum]
MEILREISRLSVDGSIGDTSPTEICLLRAHPPSHPDADAHLEFSTENIHEAALFDKIRNDQLFPQSTPPTPSLSLIFFPDFKWKPISKDPIQRDQLCNYLRLDDALLAYIVSSRSGWYHVASDNQYNFMIKDYLYMLAWTFDPVTLETRAMLAARSDYKKRSSLKNRHGEFYLPGLRVAHLYHPLSLACLCLTDFVFYFDKLIVDEGYTIGDIEEDTGHGLWVKGKPQKGFDLEKLMTASRNIAKIIGLFANLFKSVEITQTIIESLQDKKTWEEWYGRDDAESLKNFDHCTTSFSSAVGLLKLRIKTIKQSGRVMDERAKAQSNVIAALIRRQDAVTGHRLAEASKKLAEATKKDSSDMKVIAIMTMAFLPATFFAALFDQPTLAWDQPQVITSNFWVYWALTIPTTLIIFALWYILNEYNILRWRKRKTEDSDIEMNPYYGLSEGTFGNTLLVDPNEEVKSRTRTNFTGLF